MCFPMCVLYLHSLAKRLSALIYNDEKMEIVIREWLRMQEPDIYSDRIFKLVSRIGQRHQ